MTNDIKTIREALQAARNIAHAHRRGGLHNLWPQLKEALDALSRIEKYITTQQMSLFTQTPADTADYKRNV